MAFINLIMKWNQGSMGCPRPQTVLSQLCGFLQIIRPQQVRRQKLWINSWPRGRGWGLGCGFLWGSMPRARNTRCNPGLLGSYGPRGKYKLRLGKEGWDSKEAMGVICRNSWGIQEVPIPLWEVSGEGTKALLPFAFDDFVDPWTGTGSH